MIKRSHKWRNNALLLPANSEAGFTLIEMVTALAVLSLLTTVATVGFNGKGGILGQSKSPTSISQSTTQQRGRRLPQNRVNKADKDVIDEEIISDKRIDSIGFIIDKATVDKCSLQLIPKDEDDDIRFPIGFSRLRIAEQVRKSHIR